MNEVVVLPPEVDAVVPEVKDLSSEVEEIASEVKEDLSLKLLDKYKNCTADEWYANADDGLIIDQNLIPVNHKKKSSRYEDPTMMMVDACESSIYSVVRVTEQEFNAFPNKYLELAEFMHTIGGAKVVLRKMDKTMAHILQKEFSTHISYAALVPGDSIEFDPGNSSCVSDYLAAHDLQDIPMPIILRPNGNS